MSEIQLMPTGIPNLDGILGGGIPVYSLNIVAGPPGSGKTILVQQILFHYTQQHPHAKVLYLSTLSEPSRKVVRYMQYFDFFDGDAFGNCVIYRDLGELLIEYSLPEIANQIMEWVEQEPIELLVIDSFRAIYDLSGHEGDFRRFCYDLSIRLASARCTTFLVSESERDQIVQGSDFAIADGIFYLSISEKSGTASRFFQIYKLRGRSSLMEPFPFSINHTGVKILTPALTLRRRERNLEIEDTVMETGIPGLDDLLKGGLPIGRSLILSGVSGTGKTTFALQFLVNGAQNMDRGLMVSFEESRDRLHKSATNFGWDLAELEQQGLLKILFIPQTDIRIEEQLEQLILEVESFQPKRFVVDSLSVFLYRVKDPAIQREKTFQLATLMQRAGGVGILISDIPANAANQLSRFGVEETIADGTIVLSTALVGNRRERYLEVFKMRASDYFSGHHRMDITSQGIQVFYARTNANLMALPQGRNPHFCFEMLQPVIQGNVAFDSTWLVRGEAGLGKSTLTCQFLMAGLQEQVSVLYVGTETPCVKTEQLLQTLGFSIKPHVDSGALVMLDAFTRRDDEISLDDAEVLLFTLTQQLQQMPKPCYLIIDSLTPLAINRSTKDFIKLIYRKNHVLRQPGVVLFDVFLKGILPAASLTSLLNAYDIALELYRADWGEMNQPGSSGAPSLRVNKGRGVRVDTRPYPYRLLPGEGLVVQTAHYQ